MAGSAPMIVETTGLVSLQPSFIMLRFPVVHTTEILIAVARVAITIDMRRSHAAGRLLIARPGSFSHCHTLA